MMNSEIGSLMVECRKNGTAIPAFNYSDMWDLKAIITAAARHSVPVMVASNPLVARSLGVDLCQAMVEAMRRNAPIRVFSHLDHNLDPELCFLAIEAGYDSVMIDGSVSEEDDFLARVDDVVQLVGQTGVDILAVGIGTAHGFYQGDPKIHFDRLEEISKAVEIPLVLPGGTGIADEDIRRAIRLGICKVNVGAIIHTTYMTALRDALNGTGGNPYTLDIMSRMLPEIEKTVESRIRAVAGR